MSYNWSTIGGSRISPLTVSNVESSDLYSCIQTLNVGLISIFRYVTLEGPTGGENDGPGLRPRGKQLCPHSWCRSLQSLLLLLRKIMTTIYFTVYNADVYLKTQRLRRTPARPGTPRHKVERLPYLLGDHWAAIYPAL